MHKVGENELNIATFRQRFNPPSLVSLRKILINRLRIDTHFSKGLTGNICKQQMFESFRSGLAEISMFAREKKCLGHLE